MSRHGWENKKDLDRGGFSTAGQPVEEKSEGVRDPSVVIPSSKLLLMLMVIGTMLTMRVTI